MKRSPSVACVMIPGPLISWPFLLMVFVLPLLGGLVAIGLLVRAWYFHRHGQGGWGAFFNWKVRLCTAFVVLVAAWVGVLIYKTTEFKREFAIESWKRGSRAQFVLDRDFQYGEFTVPKGTLVNRRDVFDNGEPQRPLGLRGLDALQFPEPVQLAGLWVDVLETSPGRMRLTADQRISPVYHSDPDSGDWVVDPSRPFIDCKAGEVAWFNTPLIDYDIQAEFTTGEPDGAAARFKPSQWQFTHCESDWGPMEIKPAFAEPMPAGATPQVFTRQN